MRGKKLTDAGWPPGTRYDRTEYANAIYLVKQPPDEGRYKVSGKGMKPIIDLSGGLVTRLFPAPQTHVRVTITAESITITRPTT